MTFQFIELQSMGKPVRLEYAWLNEACGSSARSQSTPVIVFLHEGLGSIAMWRDFPQKLCTALSLKGLVYSRYGYGRSTLRPKNEVWRTDYLHIQAKDILPELLQALQVDSENVWLFGHSDGASIALIYAAMYPTKLAGAIVMAPHIFVEDVTISGVKAMIPIYQATDMKAKLKRYHDDPDSAFWAWNDAWLQPEFSQWNIESLLSEIGCPLLCIQGYNDQYATMAQLDGIKSHVPHAELLKLENCGHSPHKDQAESVIASTRDFISRF